jgi:IclR family transcriptional regulator, KDG regulon repressor
VADKVPRTAKNKPPATPVDIALAVLTAVASSEGASAQEIAVSVSVNRRLVSQALQRLDRRGLVVKDPLNLYWIGAQLRPGSGQPGRGSALIAAGGEVMDRLAKQLCGGIALAQRVDSELVLVAYRTAPDVSPVPSLAASRGPLYQGGGAKLMLAHAPSTIIDEVIEKHIEEFTPPALRTREAVLEVLEQIRSDGFYISIGELDPEIFTISVPIRDAKRRVVAAMALIGRPHRLTPEATPGLIAAIIDGAKQISKRLG